MTSTRVSTPSSSYTVAPAAPAWAAPASSSALRVCEASHAGQPPRLSLHPLQPLLPLQPLFVVLDEALGVLLEEGDTLAFPVALLVAVVARCAAARGLLSGSSPGVASAASLRLSLPSEWLR